MSIVGLLVCLFLCEKRAVVLLFEQGFTLYLTPYVYAKLLTLTVCSIYTLWMIIKVYVFIHFGGFAQNTFFILKTIFYAFVCLHLFITSESLRWSVAHDKCRKQRIFVLFVAKVE